MNLRDHLRSNIVGYLAVILAAGTGTAYATHPGGNNTIDSADIINGQVRTADLAPWAVREADLAPGAVLGYHLATDSVGSEDIRTQAVQASELGTVTTVEKTVSVPALGGVGEVTATCLSGQKLMGGGAYFERTSGELSASRRVFGSHTWLAAGQNNGNAPQNLTVQVICLVD